MHQDDYYKWIKNKKTKKKLELTSHELEEFRANEFALNLLLPSDLFIDYVLSKSPSLEQARYNPSVIFNTSKRFAVDVDIVMIKLDELLSDVVYFNNSQRNKIYEEYNDCDVLCAVFPHEVFMKNLHLIDQSVESALNNPYIIEFLGMTVGFPDRIIFKKLETLKAIKEKDVKKKILKFKKQPE